MSSSTGQFNWFANFFGVSHVSLVPGRIFYPGRTMTTMAFFLFLGQTQVQASDAQVKAKTQALAPISIDEVHENDGTVQGQSPLLNVPLTVKINGVAGVSTANPNGATGRFAIVLPQPAKNGNFIEISGVASNGTKISGSTTVSAASNGSAAVTPAKTVSLSVPSITAAHEGDKSIRVTRNSADSQTSLSLHIDLLSPKDGSTVWQGDCTPDATLSCSVTPNPQPLVSGQVINAKEVLVSAGVSSASKVVTNTVVTGQGLSTPTIVASEGSPIVSVTPDKADAGRPGLRIAVNVLDSQAKAALDTSSKPVVGSCAPNTPGGQCQVNLPVPVNGTWKVLATETTGSESSVPVTADPAPLAALGKPTISAPHQGDKTVTVTLNAADVAAVKPPAQLTIAVTVTSAGKPKPYPCLQVDSSNQCKIALAEELLDGDLVTAQEGIGGVVRSIDPIAVASVVNDALGIPSVATLREGDTSAYLKIAPADFLKWPGKVSLAAAIYNGPNPIPGQSQTCSPADNTKDYCTVTLLTLAQGQTLHVKEIPGASAAGTPSAPGPETIVDVQELGYNWGRVRAYFSAGAVFSRSNITTSNATSQPTVTAANFTSPDAFVAMDMDFNWYTRQGCLAAAYINGGVKLATLSDAVAECDSKIAVTEIFPKGDPSGNLSASTKGTKKQARDGNVDEQDGTSPPKSPDDRKKNLLAVLSVTSDVDSAKVLGFLVRAYQRQIDTAGNQVIPKRIERIVDQLPNKSRLATCKAGSTPDHACQTPKILVAELGNLELTPWEARQLLMSSTSGFERKDKWGVLINSYFQSKLTQTAASNGFALASSPNSVHMEGGIYAPFYFNWTRWTFSHQPYALFFAPIGKLGFDSLRGSATDQLTQATLSATGATAGQLNFQNAAKALSKDVYRDMSFGGRLGFFRFAPTPNRAPELISYVDFTYGRYDNFFVQKYDNPLGALHYPWRFDLIGVLNVPATPLYVGGELNKVTGPDSLSIFVGLRTDLSSTLGKLIPTVK